MNSVWHPHSHHRAFRGDTQGQSIEASRSWAGVITLNSRREPSVTFACDDIPHGASAALDVPRGREVPDLQSSTCCASATAVGHSSLSPYLRRSQYAVPLLCSPWDGPCIVGNPRAETQTTSVPQLYYPKPGSPSGAQTGPPQPTNKQQRSTITTKRKTTRPRTPCEPKQPKNLRSKHNTSKRPEHSCSTATGLHLPKARCQQQPFVSPCKPAAVPQGSSGLRSQRPPRSPESRTEPCPLKRGLQHNAKRAAMPHT